MRLRCATGGEDDCAVAYTSAAFNLTMPDARHIATARAASCTAFLTNGKRLRLPQDIDRIEFAVLA
jgi:hypothetical protein